MCTARRSCLRRCLVVALLALLGLMLAPGAWAQPSMIMAMGHAGGQSHDLVDVHLTLLTMGSDSGNPLSVSGLDLTVVWDAEMAEVESLLLTEATANWLIAANPAPGSVVVSMATIEPASAAPAGQEMLVFRFRLLDKIGQTPLQLVDTRAFDIDQVFIEHIPVDGRLDVGIVANESTSLGRLKRTFAP